MSKKTKRWLIIAASLVVLGLIIFTAVMTVNNWDFTKLSTVKYGINDYQISKEFNNVLLKTDTANIFLVPSDDKICKVVCYEQENAKHSVEVKEDTLVIEVVDTKKWYEHIGITFETPKITIYLPKREYDSFSIKESTGDIEIPKGFKFESIDISSSTGDVKNYSSASESIKINTSTGDICVGNVSAGSLELSVSTGKVIANDITCEGDVKVKVSTGDTKLIDAQCKNIISNGSTGDISLKNVVATEKLSIERSTGDVKFDECDAAEIFIKTDTGSVKGNLLTNKVFITRTDTGSVDVPKTVTGGKCEIVTDTGDIKIDIQ